MYTDTVTGDVQQGKASEAMDESFTRGFATIINIARPDKPDGAQGEPQTNQTEQGENTQNQTGSMSMDQTPSAQGEPQTNQIEQGENTPSPTEATNMDQRPSVQGGSGNSQSGPSVAEPISGQNSINLQIFSNELAALREQTSEDHERILDALGNRDEWTRQQFVDAAAFLEHAAMNVS